MTDHHAQRYAAGEALAKAARVAAEQLARIPALFTTLPQQDAHAALVIALAEYERTRDHP